MSISKEHSNGFSKQHSDGVSKQSSDAVSQKNFDGTRLNRTCGFKAHSSVPASHWCITKRDLKDLRASVQQCVSQGSIQPTSLDPFDINDNRYGPCVHTVVTQMMKPMSMMSGGSSYALIRHPSGLKCDVFVTHGWAEGIYEFIDKVLNSWPHGKRHAYCCMLSNPQTLDVQSMLVNPADSPFAEALRSASHVLVVPNRQNSVYSRVWCTYEAFLAYKWDKVIYVAVPPLEGLRCKMLMFLVCYVLSVAFHAGLSSWLSETARHRLAWTQGSANMFLMIVALTVPISSIQDWFISAAAFSQIGSSFEYLKSEVPLDAQSCQGLHLVVFVILYFPAAIMPHVFWWCVLLDREHENQATVETALLEAGYSGSIRDCKASVHQDKVQILSELRGEEAYVDSTIEVLLKSGMSTLALRIAHEKGVDISGVGRLSRRCLCAGLYSFTLVYRLTYSRFLTHQPITAVLLFLSLAWCLFSCMTLRRDKVALVSIALWKCVGIPFMLLTIVLWFARALNIKMEFLTGPLERNGCNIIAYLAILVAFTPFLDLGMLASFPVVGKGLAQNLVTSDVFWFTGRPLTKARNKRQIRLKSRKCVADIKEIEMT